MTRAVRALWSTRGLRANDAVKTRAKIPWKFCRPCLAKPGVVAILFQEIYWALSLPPYLNNCYCTDGIKLATICRKWCLFFSVNIALHAELAKLWRHNDIIFVRYLTMTLVPTTSHRPKRDVTIVSGSLATLHTRVPITTATPSGDFFFSHRQSINNMAVILLKGDMSPHT